MTSMRSRKSARDLREIEQAAEEEAIDVDPIDLDQVVLGFAAANEQRLQQHRVHRSGRGRRRECSAEGPWRWASVAGPQFLGGDNAQAAALLTGRDVDGGAQHLYRVFLRGQREFYGGGAGPDFERLGGETVGSDEEFRVLGRREIEAAGAGEVRNAFGCYPDRFPDRNASLGNGLPFEGSSTVTRMLSAACKANARHGIVQNVKRRFTCQATLRRRLGPIGHRSPNCFDAEEICAESRGRSPDSRIDSTIRLPILTGQWLCGSDLRVYSGGAVAGIPPASQK